MSAKNLIVGLGNPGRKYAQTRHNIGFQVVEELVERGGLGAGRNDKHALTWDGRIKSRPVKLAQPMTYMNRSGESVRQLLDYYRIPLSNLLVIHDDLDTPFGMLRLRQTGGHGGQNGLRSIIRQLGSKDFARLRFGIGRPPGRMDPVHYVLQRFQGDDVIRASELVERAADAVEVWLCDGIEQAMSRFNGGASGIGSAPTKRDLARAACDRAARSGISPRRRKAAHETHRFAEEIGAHRRRRRKSFEVGASLGKPGQRIARHSRTGKGGFDSSFACRCAARNR